MEITKEFIEKELISPKGSLKRKKMNNLNISEEIVYMKFHNIEKPNCQYCNGEVKLKNFTKGQVKNFKDYAKLVWRYTNQNDLSVLENIELRGQAEYNYHLDHKYSIFQGFKDNIPAEIIGNICNLEMLLSGQNLSKNRKCGLSKNELLSKYVL